jgi:hypothetical protein
LFAQVTFKVNQLPKNYEKPFSVSPTPSSGSDDRRSESSSAFRGVNAGSDSAAAEAENGTSNIGHRSFENRKMDGGDADGEAEAAEAEKEEDDMKNEATNGKTRHCLVTTLFKRNPRQDL